MTNTVWLGSLASQHDVNKNSQGYTKALLGKRKVVMKILSMLMRSRLKH